MISSQIPEYLDDEVALGFLGVRLPHNFGARCFVLRFGELSCRAWAIRMRPKELWQQWLRISRL